MILFVRLITNSHQGSFIHYFIFSFTLLQYIIITSALGLAYSTILLHESLYSQREGWERGVKEVGFEPTLFLYGQEEWPGVDYPLHYSSGRIYIINTAMICL
jgi:hypothetical protein